MGDIGIDNRLESALFERDLARKVQLRLEGEIAELRDEVASLRAELDERDQKLAAIQASRGWRLILRIRELRHRVARR